MSTLTFARSLAAAAQCDHVVLLASAHALIERRVFRHVFGGAWTKNLPRILADADPGDLGWSVSAWTGKDAPRLATLAVLPDRVSRHASPSRNHAVHECLSKVEKKGGSIGVVLCVDDPSHATAVANAVGRAFPLYSRKTRRAAKAAKVVVAVIDRDGKLVPPSPSLVRTVESARWAADVVERPTAELTTAGFVDEAIASLGALGRKASVKVLVGDQLLAAGLGGVHAVGRAAEVPPRLLVMEAKPSARGKAAFSRRVALVGKGIVFDTGGLDLKTREGMSGMKADMGGGAAVVGAFRTLLSEGSPHHLTCLVPLAENAIGPGAFRPDEILTLHSGKTVEINNTDAEGRLLLADAVSFAARTLRAEVVVDAATLTGAQGVSTGKRHAAVVSNLEGLEQLAVRAGRLSGDLCHPLPFAPEFYQREFKSELADMLNSVRDRANAQSSCAAQFVWSHLEGACGAWLHVDLARPARPEERATGYGVALLAEVVRSLRPEDLAR